MEEKDDILNEVTNGEYKYGFVTDIDTETIPKGLSEEVVRMISAKKGEPEWMTEFRLKAYRHWLTMTMPRWPHLDLPEIDFQDIIYYAAPKQKPKLSSMDEVDPELKATFDKLGVPLEEQMLMAGVAVDAVMDSVSVKTTFRETLAEKGIIFCSFSEALRDYPELVRKYMCSVVPYTDNFFAALNTAVFSDGSFCYVPKGVHCPMELSTYFRINAAGTGQFERTLIVADEGAYVSYMEGCTAPQRDENQLHAAVVEIVVMKDAEVKYSTVQNWYPGDKDGNGGIYNFVTKRGMCRGENARNYSQCDSLLIGDRCGAHTFPYVEVNNRSAVVEHEATTSKIGEDQLFYCNQRGLSTEDAVGLIVNGYAREVLNKLPMEFAVEAQKLLSISLEGSVG